MTSRWNIQVSVLNLPQIQVSTMFFYPGCKAVRNWAIIRHGTRNPSAKTITKMKNDLYRFRDDLLYNSRLCKADRESFWSWACYLNEDQEKILVPEGEDEMIDLAERFQLRFPHLLSDNYDNSTYKVGHSCLAKRMRH